jgi:hypothetical protein
MGMRYYFSSGYKDCFVCTLITLAPNYLTPCHRQSNKKAQKAAPGLRPRIRPDSTRVLALPVPAPAVASTLPPSSSAANPARELAVREDMAGKKRKSGSEKPTKHRLPLGADADAVAEASKRRRSGATKQHQADEEASIPPSLSAKILREARKQQEEEMRADSSDEQRPSAVEATAGPSTSSSFPVPAADGENEGDDVDEFDGFDALSEYDGGEVRGLQD